MSPFHCYQWLTVILGFGHHPIVSCQLSHAAAFTLVDIDRKWGCRYHAAAADEIAESAQTMCWMSGGTPSLDSRHGQAIGFIYTEMEFLQSSHSSIHQRFIGICSWRAKPSDKT